MRVALATSSYAPYVGGVEEHVRNVARVLREHGHEVVVWTVARDGRFATRTIDGIQVQYLPAPLPARSLGAMLSLAGRLPRAAMLWDRAFRRFRPDVIHVQCFGPNGTYARVLARNRKTPMILTAHGETVADDAGVFTRSKFAVASLRRAITEAFAVTGCSKAALDDLTARFGLERGSGHVVFNGIDLAERIGDPPPGAHGRYIAAVGRVQRVKGFDLLIEAFARAELPSNVRLVIGGGGPELDALRAQAEKLGVGERVLLPGWLDRASVGGLLRGAMMGVVPSRFESFGIGALEVWRAGSTLVATLRGGPPEFVRDDIDGVLVDPEDVDDLARKLASLAANPERAARLAAAGAERVRDFTWERAVDAYESIYVAALSHRPRA